MFSWGLGRFGVLGRSYSEFTYQTDVGMVVPEGEEGHNAQGAAARPAPVLAAPLDAAVAADEDHGEGIGGLIQSLEALNLVRGRQHIMRCVFLSSIYARSHPQCYI